MNTMRWVGTMAIAAAMLSGCSTAPAVAPTEEVVAVAYADGETFADLGEVADVAGTVVTGRFTGNAEVIAAETLFPDDAAMPGSGISYALWTFRVDSSAKGSAGRSESIQVMVPTWETDIEGLSMDPTSIRGKRVVLMLESDPRDTAYGDAFFLAANHQFGAAFAAVDDDGVIMQDKRSFVPVPPRSSQAQEALDRVKDRKGSEDEIAEAVAAQLGLEP